MPPPNGVVPLGAVPDTPAGLSGALSETRRHSPGSRPETERAPIEPASLATDIAEELVRRGIPFRKAHETVARWTLLAARSRSDVREIAAIESPALRSFLHKLTPASSVARRDLPGGTAPRRVKAAIARTRRLLESAMLPVSNRSLPTRRR